MKSASALTKQEPDTVLDSSARVPADTDPDPHSPDERPPRRTPPFQGIADIFFPGKPFKSGDIPGQIVKKIKPFLDKNLSPEKRRQKALDLIEATGEDNDLSELLKSILSSVKPFRPNNKPEHSERKFLPFLDEITGLENRREKAKELISTIQENDDLFGVLKGVISSLKPFRPDNKPEQNEGKFQPFVGEATGLENRREKAKKLISTIQENDELSTLFKEILSKDKPIKPDNTHDLPLDVNVLEPSSGEPMDAGLTPHSPDGRPPHRKPDFAGKPDDLLPEKPFKPDVDPDLLVEVFKPFSNKNIGFKTHRKKALELITALHEKNGTSAFFNPDLALTAEEVDPVTNPQLLRAQTEEQDETQSINDLKTELRFALGTYPTFTEIQNKMNALTDLAAGHPLDSDII